MAVFMDTGGGDIYAADTKEQCIAAMLEDSPDTDVTHAFEVSGNTKMRVEEEGAEVGISTLDEEYVPMTLGGYCIASENC